MIAGVTTTAKPEEGCLNRTAEEVKRVSAVREELESVGVDIDHLFKICEVYGKCLVAHFAIEVIVIGESGGNLEVLETECFLFGPESKGDLSTELSLRFVQVGKAGHDIYCIKAVTLQLFETL